MARDVCLASILNILISFLVKISLLFFSPIIINPFTASWNEGIINAGLNGKTTECAIN